MRGNAVKKGDTIHVEFDGVVEDEGYDHSIRLGNCFLVKSDNSGYYHAIYPYALKGESFNKSGNGDFVKADPSYWPPVIGDMWLAGNGTTYFIRANQYNPKTVTATTPEGDHKELPQVEKELKAGKLVYRKGVKLGS